MLLTRKNRVLQCRRFTAAVHELQSTDLKGLLEKLRKRLHLVLMNRSVSWTEGLRVLLCRFSTDVIVCVLESKIFDCFSRQSRIYHQGIAHD